MKKALGLLVLVAAFQLSSDDFHYNSANNHGTLGVINIPSARFYDSPAASLSFYRGYPDRKAILSLYPYDWFEASVFYSSIEGKPYGSGFSQSYKDKGFNVKVRVKEEGKLPAIAIGLQDFAGTGIYSSEYIVGSYGINKTDFHFGLGFGLLDGSDQSFKNPLSLISDKFNDRPTELEGLGGSFQPSRYFSGETVSPFFGVSHVVRNKLILKLEHDTSVRPGLVPFREPKSDYSFGFDYLINDNFSIGMSFERGDYATFKFVYKNDPISTYQKSQYARGDLREGDNKYTQLINNLEENGIGVKKLTESAGSIGLQLTQVIHPNLQVVEQIIAQSARDAGITKDIKKDIEIANLLAVSEIDDAYEKTAQTIYERQSSKKYSTSTRLQFRPFLASREEFFKGALMLENDTEFIIRKNLFFNTNLKYSLADNFDDLYLPPINTFPAQVRSDVKEYLNKVKDGGILIGRAQFDYLISPTLKHHFMFSGGILENMFSGIGMEYLYFKQDSNFGVGFEVFEVQKRDYKLQFGTLDYKNTTGHINFYHRNYKFIPFDTKISMGEYLAGDIGSTIQFSRSYMNGVEYGVFATFTDVSSKQFGEGSFDKGIFFNVPIFSNFINYSWRPLTKDPGAKLTRVNTLHDLLIRFKPIN